MLNNLYTWFKRNFSHGDYGRKKRAVAHTVSLNMAPLHLVGDFMERHNIETSPTHYELVYRHQVSNEPGLDHIIDKLIETGEIEETQTEDQAYQLGNELCDIADLAQTQLHAVELLLGRSNKDARGFGNALESKTRDASAKNFSNEFVEGLFKLTQTMIKKTRVVEEELRARQKAVNDLQNSLADAKYRADTDALTGLSNRRAFERELGAACERAKSGSVKLSLAICDVDHFKAINDGFGHVTGDRVLQLVGDILRTHCSPHGDVYRFGGEEFVIICEGLDADDAESMVDAARRDLAARRIVKKETNESLGAISFSGGVCEFQNAGSSQEMLKMADKALYRAKLNGRNIILTSDLNRAGQTDSSAVH